MQLFHHSTFLWPCPLPLLLVQVDCIVSEWMGTMLIFEFMVDSGWCASLFAAVALRVSDTLKCPRALLCCSQGLSLFQNGLITPLSSDSFSCLAVLVARDEYLRPDGLMLPSFVRLLLAPVNAQRTFDGAHNC